MICGGDPSQNMGDCYMDRPVPGSLWFRLMHVIKDISCDKFQNYVFCILRTVKYMKSPVRPVRHISIILRLNSVYLYSNMVSVTYLQGMANFPEPFARNALM